MALYARSDLMSIAIPQPRGCGAVHSRPVTHGAPAKEWKLTCEDCESELRGDRRGKVIKYLPGDKDKMIAPKMVHIADMDPHWSTTPEGIPLTPDESDIHKLRATQGRQQLDMLQAYAALSKIPGLDLKDYKEAMWLLDQTIDPLRRPSVAGKVLCPNRHDNTPGTKFCGECGTRMDALAVLEEAPTPLEEIIPLRNLHIATLKKRAREKGLSDKGTKAQLIDRLESV